MRASETGGRAVVVAVWRGGAWRSGAVVQWFGGPHRSERTAGECGGEDDEVSVRFLGEEHCSEHAEDGTAGGARDEGGGLCSHVTTQASMCQIRQW